MVDGARLMVTLNLLENVYKNEDIVSSRPKVSNL